MDATMRDRAYGAIIGGAAGDALGAPVEFQTANDIRAANGHCGITEYHAWGGHPVGSWTDDTQMTLATANGLFAASIRGDDHAGVLASIWREYRVWHASQRRPHNRRAPGVTCMSAIGGGVMGTIEKPLNKSMGCGGVMRVAPIGIVYPPGQAFIMGAQVAAMTHGHVNGWLPAGVMADTISRLLEGESLRWALGSAMYENRTPGDRDTERLIHMARAYSAQRDMPDEVIPTLGMGWTGHEALAIGAFCALRFASFDDAIIAAVNHDGDSDSTGAIAGSLYGASVGLPSIDRKWTDDLERSDDLVVAAHTLMELRGTLPPPRP